MPAWGLTDKPDSNQAKIVRELHALGWFVQITKRPVDLWVASPDGETSFWVEIKASKDDPLTKCENEFFLQCPRKFRVVAVTTNDIVRHWKRVAEYSAAYVTKAGRA